MSDRAFFDTNIFVYAIDEASPAKRATARQLIEDALVNGTGATSFQVVHEWMNVALRRLAMPPRDAELFLDRFLLPLWRVQPSPDLCRLALSIHRQSGWSWYDSLIVGAASLDGCAILYSEDLQSAGRTVRGVRIVNPFRPIE